MHLAGGAAEAEGDSVEPGPGDVQRTTGNDGESQSRTGVDVNDRQPIAGPAVQAVFAHPTDLRNVPDARHQFGAAELMTPEMRHGGSRLATDDRRLL